MRTYKVMWEIDVSADSPKEAAEKAREIQLDPNSLATVFRMSYDWGRVTQVDLSEEDQ